jgi:hypothetical protein
METHWMDLLLGLADAYRHALIAELWELARQYAGALVSLTQMRHTADDWIDAPAIRDGMLTLLDGQRVDCRSTADEAASNSEGVLRWWIEYYSARLDRAFALVYVEIDESEAADARA